MGGPRARDGLALREASSQPGAARTLGFRRREYPSSVVHRGQRGYSNGVGWCPLASWLVSGNPACRPGRRGGSHVSTTVSGRGRCSSPECALHASPRVPTRPMAPRVPWRNGKPPQPWRPKILSDPVTLSPSSQDRASCTDGDPQRPRLAPRRCPAGQRRPGVQCPGPRRSRRCR